MQLTIEIIFYKIVLQNFVKIQRTLTEKTKNYILITYIKKEYITIHFKFNN